MNTISILQEEVIAVIAAGEVIERPMYIVKELLDNALDAGASTIEITTEGKDITSISCLDNGHGMSVEDLSMCCRLHATSKLHTAEDLSAITTYGFRGEALASIAAVATICIESKEESEPIGSRLLVRGTSQSIEPVGMTAGTRVIISDIFDQLPVRKKSALRTASELRKVREYMTSWAIAHPSIAIRYRHDGKIIFNRPSENLLPRISALLGAVTAKDLLPLQCTDAYFSISGFISPPQLHFSSTHHQYFSMNGRCIKDRNLERLVRSAYDTLLPRDAYPLCILQCSAPVELVDVNRDPKKETVFFQDEQRLLSSLFDAMKEILYDTQPFFSAASWQRGTSNIARPKASLSLNRSHAAELLRRHTNPPESSSPELNMATLTQVHDTFIFAESDQGIVLIDQHAADECIQYNKLCLALQDQEKVSSSTPIEPPYPLALPVPDLEIIKETISTFSMLGFTFDFSVDPPAIQAVPSLYKDRDVLPILSHTIAEVRESIQRHLPDASTSLMLKSLACKSAVRAGDRLTKKDMKRIVSALFHTRPNTTCPHGRPTMVTIPSSTLNTLFHRN